MQIDELNTILNRLEDLAGANARLQLRLDDAERRAKQRTAEILYGRNTKEQLAAAEAKVSEWAEYASVLRSAISQRALKRKDIVLPDPPKPLETDIPF